MVKGIFFFFFSEKDSKKNLFFRHLHTHTQSAHCYELYLHTAAGLLDSLHQSINALYRKHSFTLNFISCSLIHLFQSIPLEALPVKTQETVTQYTETLMNSKD